MSETLSQCLQESYESVKEIIGRYRIAETLQSCLRRFLRKLVFCLKCFMTVLGGISSEEGKS